MKLELKEKSPRLSVTGTYSTPDRRNKRNLTFVQDHAGISGLAERVSDVQVINTIREPIPVKRFIPGEYVASADFTGWSYNLRLSQTGTAQARAHVSWIDGNVGILFLYDILPVSFETAPASGHVTIQLPADWEVLTVEKRAGPSTYDVEDLEKAVFVVSKKGSRHDLGINRPAISLFGSWQFSSAEAVTAAQSVLNEYERLFGRKAASSQIAMMRLPGHVPAGQWEADTRGRSITILSSDTPFTTQSIQRLHEQLRHEMFHLWFPEGAGLEGRYDWFYEGFALYQSLKIGIGMNRLSFQDVLDSLSQAINVDAAQVRRESLIAASDRRWGGSNSTIYARGMLVAFLSDLAMLRRSNGKVSVENLIRDVYAQALARPRQNGNELILASMRRRPELNSIIDRYITGAERVELRDELFAAGIVAIGDPSAIRLSVAANPNSRQKAILDKLGYNNWRKLSETSK